MSSPGEHRVDVELGQRGATVVEGPARQHLEPVEQRGGARPAVGLDQPDDDVRAAGRAAVRLPEHGVGLADPRRRTQVDPQLAARAHGVIIRPSCRALP